MLYKMKLGSIYLKQLHRYSKQFFYFMFMLALAFSSFSYMVTALIQTFVRKGLAKALVWAPWVAANLMALAVQVNS